MTIRQLPEIIARRPSTALAFEMDDDVLARWTAGLRAEQTAENTIEILDVIGEDYWTGGGVTVERISADLRAFADRDIYVDINSPGGDVFEGIAIYNALRSHKHRVTVRVLGWAASAASIIAMSGDRIEIAKSAFMMLHNAWGLVVGNQFDLQEALETLQPIDEAMAGVYAERASVSKEKASAWMARNRGGGTWFNGDQAIDAGLADGFLSVDTVIDAAAAKAAGPINATRRLDTMMARQGIPRSERRSLLGEVKEGTPGAALSVTQDADDWMAAARQLTELMRS